MSARGGVGGGVLTLTGLKPLTDIHDFYVKMFIAMRYSSSYLEPYLDIRPSQLSLNLD